MTLRKAGGKTRAFAVIVALFFLWGMAHNLNDILIPHFKRAFSLSDFQSGLVQSAFYFGYFCFALPAARWTQSRGFKSGIVLGLLLYGAGALLFLPAAAFEEYTLFLVALYVIAAGLAFLETSANPLVTVLGPADRADQRLTFAQAFNPLGSLTGIGLGAFFLLDGSGGEKPLSAVEVPYAIVAVVVLLTAYVVSRLDLPEGVDRADAEPVHLSQLWRLMAQPAIATGVVAQFAYVGAQVGIWSFLIRYATAASPELSEQGAAKLLLLSLVLFMAGRFAGAYAMRTLAAPRLLMAAAAAAVLLSVVAALTSSIWGIAALVLVSFPMSIMFPTIFSLTLRGQAPAAKPVSALLVMSIVGGAVLTAMMGLVSDLSGHIQFAMLVPASAFVVILMFARGRMA